MRDQNPWPLGEEKAPGEEGVGPGRAAPQHTSQGDPPAPSGVPGHCHTPAWVVSSLQRWIRKGQQQPTDGGRLSITQGRAREDAPWMDAVMVVTQEIAWEDAPRMDAVTVVTQERAREDAPWVDVPWANTEHRLALLSGGRRPEGPWSVSCTDRVAGSLGQCGRPSTVTDTPLLPLSCWNPGSLPRRPAG